MSARPCDCLTSDLPTALPRPGLLLTLAHCISLLARRDSHRADYVVFTLSGHCEQIDEHHGHQAVEPDHSLVRPDSLVTDSPLLHLEGAVYGDQMVEHGADQGELQALLGEEVGEDDPEDGADVPASEDGLQELLYRRLPGAGLAVHYEGLGFVGRDLEEVAQAEEEVTRGDQDQCHGVECCHDGSGDVCALTMPENTLTDKGRDIKLYNVLHSAYSLHLLQGFIRLEL